MAKNIAIVDDDPSVCKGLNRLLRSADYSATSFASPEECIASSGLHDVDCFLVDVYLGAISGFDLARKLRDLAVLAPIIFMTGHDENATREALQAAGSPVCLRKPMGSDAVLGAIGTALGL